jgi:hypothetical protein
MKTRLILCRNCNDWKQLPNEEQGTCIFDEIENTTNYDTRCLLGISESVITPEVETMKVEKL